MPTASRIVSFLPSATEMVCVLGLADRLVGITHECDYPPTVRGKPVVIGNAIAIEQLTQAGIDQAVAERVREGRSVYQVDENLLRELAPDVILAQDLCQVCAMVRAVLLDMRSALVHLPTAQARSSAPQILARSYGISHGTSRRILRCASGLCSVARDLVYVYFYDRRAPRFSCVAKYRPPTPQSESRLAIRIVGEISR